MAKKEIFVCDQCHKSSSHMVQGSDLPYLHGWRSLEEFSFKASSQFSHEAVRKHFCSNNCLLAFIASFIKEQEEQVNSYGQKFAPDAASQIPERARQFADPVPLMMRGRH